jgi:tRNA threonylcarbamoyladenosine biosynthesis protein TsaB
VTILAVDTATPWGSVALLRAGETIGEVRLRSPEGHSAALLPAVSFLLDRLGLPPGAVEGYAVGAGPGSFTGIRVGLSTVQGLALGSGRPCLGLSTLDALAAKARGAADSVVAMVDAYRGEVYAELYDAAGRPLGQAGAWRPEALLDRVGGAAPAFVGDGARKYASLIRERCPGAMFPERSPFLAAWLGRLAEPRLRAGDGHGPEALRPIYLREADVRRAPP